MICATVDVGSYSIYACNSTWLNIARRARSRRAKSLGLPMPYSSTGLKIALEFQPSHAILSLHPLYLACQVVQQSCFTAVE